MHLNQATETLLRFRSLTWSFAQRELRARYKHTILGWVWSLAMPLATLAVYSVVFGIIFKSRAPELGNGHGPIYAVWLFCGLVAFSFFSNGVMRAIEALLAAGALRQKVYFPVSTPVLGAIVSCAFQSLVEVALLLCVFAALGNVAWTWLLLPVWALIMVGFTVGVALACAVATAFARDVAHAAAVLLQLAFFATPVLYPVADVPQDALGGALHALVATNPLGSFISMFRSLTYDLTPGEPDTWLVMLASTTVALGVGMFVAERYGHELAERL